MNFKDYKKILLGAESLKEKLLISASLARLDMPLHENPPPAASHELVKSFSCFLSAFVCVLP